MQLLEHPAAGFGFRLQRFSQKLKYLMTFQVKLEEAKRELREAGGKKKVR